MNDLYKFMTSREPKIPTNFKVWMGICAIFGLAITGVVIWAVVKVVSHFCG